MADPLASLIGSDPAAFPRPTVQLQHVLPDGSSHIDWMIAQDSAGRLPLMTFRLPRPLHQLEPGRLESITRLPDHRPMYLDYEGPLTENRGHVERLARGYVVRIRPLSTEDHRLVELTMTWSVGPRLGEKTSVDPFILAIRHDHEGAWSIQPLTEKVSSAEGTRFQNRRRLVEAARSKES